ncbi:hypothetical protein [Aureimonas sp. SK2]|uniref:hypothetical protein n=1 Tax=Aureimonas sp. SK2 TaxID=3015992 RepID=UPI0024446476|nr:hypothetical protein [Aureimonas sp. SK2]
MTGPFRPAAHWDLTEFEARVFDRLVHQEAITREEVLTLSEGARGFVWGIQRKVSRYGVAIELTKAGDGWQLVGRHGYLMLCPPTDQLRRGFGG